MTADTLQKEIEEAVPKLLDVARDLTWSKLPDDCRYILTEIKDSLENSHTERLVKITENKKKIPVPLEELMPLLREMYNNLYDINLHVYRSTKKLTIIDFRYYPKSSLEEDYRQTIIDNPPMLHCKMHMPRWLSDKKKQFDINWEHYSLLISWKMFWAKQKFYFEERKRKKRLKNKP